MVRLLKNARVTLYRCAVFTIIVGLAACSTQPRHTLIAKSAQATPAPKSDRYQTRKAAVPPVVNQLLAQARSALRDRNPSLARTKLERAQRIASTHSTTYLLLGHVYWMEENDQKARQMYRRAESLAVDNAERTAARNALAKRR